MAAAVAAVLGSGETNCFSGENQNEAVDVLRDRNLQSELSDSSLSLGLEAADKKVLRVMVIGFFF
jgi:hypothetical protein